MSEYKKSVDKDQREELVEEVEERDANRDPITGEAGSHPVGVAAGGSAGAATGAAIGAAVGGPVGAVVGGAIGAVAGGLTGKAVAEVIDPTVEEAYWKKNYQSRPYYSPGRQYYDYGTAYRYGWESAVRPENSEKKFEDIESDLETSWPSYRNTDKDSWQDFREAVRDAYNRVKERR